MLRAATYRGGVHPLITWLFYPLDFQLSTSPLTTPIRSFFQKAVPKRRHFHVTIDCCALSAALEMLSVH